MTLEQIRQSNQAMLRPQDVAEVIGCQAQAINELAKRDRLPFPYIRSGNRTKIPREGFLRWYQGR